MKMKRSEDVYPGFDKLVSFMKEVADEATDPVYGWMSYKSNQDTRNSKKSSTATNFTANTSSHLSGTPPPCILCKKDHRLFYCQVFKNMKPQDRLQLVKKNKLCENCLLSNHVVSYCRKPSVCSVDGCGRKHTKFIHINEPVDSVNETKQAGSDNIKIKDNEVSDSTLVNVSTSIEVNVHMPVVEVRVNDQCNTYALLDTASPSSFCSQKLVDKLKIEGTSFNFQLNTLSLSQSDKTSQIVDLNLVSPNNGEALRLTDVYVVEDIPFKTSSVDVENDPHHQDIPLNINNDSTVLILIGQDNVETLIPLEAIRGKEGDHFAVRTLFD